MLAATLGNCILAGHVVIAVRQTFLIPRDSACEMASHSSADALVTSSDPKHPANHICSLCKQFYTFGWVTGTGGGVSIRNGNHIFIAPSGVEKELMQPENIFVMDFQTKEYLRRPLVGSQHKQARPR